MCHNVEVNEVEFCVTQYRMLYEYPYVLLLLLLLVGGGAKEEQQRLNLSDTLCRPSIRPITIFHRFFFCFLFYSD